MPPTGYKILTVKEETLQSLVSEAGKLQWEQGKYVSVATFVEEILEHWKECSSTKSTTER